MLCQTIIKINSKKNPVNQMSLAVQESLRRKRWVLSCFLKIFIELEFRMCCGSELQITWAVKENERLPLAAIMLGTTSRFFSSELSDLHIPMQQFIQIRGLIILRTFNVKIMIVRVMPHHASVRPRLTEAWAHALVPQWGTNTDNSKNNLKSEYYIFMAPD